MKSLLAGAAVLTLLTTSAFAQSSGTQNQTTAQSNQSTSHNLVAAQKIQQDLQSAGFTDVKIVAESFVVQAKSKDGDPVLMTIGPHGMSVFEAMNANSSGSGSTTGSSSANSMKSGAQSK